jgi:membrane protease YdiL (CAAX protease family)
MREMMTKSDISFESKDNYKLIFGGIVLAIVYKFWKLFCGNFTHNYFIEQILFSFFRIAASVVAFELLKKQNDSFVGLILFKEKVKSISFILSYVFFVFIVYYFLFDSFTFQIKIFAFEMVINSIVGVFEELLFRGLLFLSFRKKIGFFFSLFLSSFIFSIWHYDVVSNWSNYISIFTFGVFACVLLENGFGFISLIFMHAAYDLIHYGFDWNPLYSPAVGDFAIAVLDLIFIILCIYFFNKNSQQRTIV